MIRKFAAAGVLCAATGLAGPAAAAPAPATCQAVKPVLDEIIAGSLAAGRGIDPGPNPHFPPGYDPVKDILGHYRRAGEAALSGARKTPDPHVADLLRRMSAVLLALGSGKAPSGAGQKPPLAKADGEELAKLEKECGYAPDLKKLGLGGEGGSGNDDGE